MVFFVTLGCNQKEKQEIARLNKENQTLTLQTHQKDSAVNEIFQSLNTIESNLSEIKAKESIISVKSSGKDEVTPEVRTRINDDIKVINDLMNKNKKEIARLNRLLKQSNLKSEEVDKKMAELTRQLGTRDSLIASLKTDLEKMNFSVASLNASLDTMKNQETQLKSTVSNKTKAMNTAYYVAGTKKQLLAENVISKQGGFVGIGRSNKLRPDFNETKFQRIDIRQLNEIPVNSKKIEIVTTHPKSSYEVEKNQDGNVDKIKITDPDKFWSASKYLVVMEY
jgi:DNA repair exonuclease SbcCD ATPase subunit